jgi:hypothetical protein
MTDIFSRVLEPEVMNTIEEAIAYDRMDFTVINTAFADRAIELASQLDSALVLDVGTGTARIPILRWGCSLSCP